MRKVSCSFQILYRASLLVVAKVNAGKFFQPSIVPALKLASSTDMLLFIWATYGASCWPHCSASVRVSGRIRMCLWGWLKCCSHIAVHPSCGGSLVYCAMCSVEIVSAPVSLALLVLMFRSLGERLFVIGDLWDLSRLLAPVVFLEGVCSKAWFAVSPCLMVGDTTGSCWFVAIAWVVVLLASVEVTWGCMFAVESLASVIVGS